MGMFPRLKQDTNFTSVLSSRGTAFGSGPYSLRMQLIYPKTFLPGLPFDVTVKFISRHPYGEATYAWGYGDVYLTFPWGRVKVPCLNNCCEEEPFSQKCRGRWYWHWMSTKQSVVVCTGSVTVHPPTILPFSFYGTYSDSKYGSYSTEETPKVTFHKLNLGKIIQKIDSVCTSDRREKPFFGISTDYDITGDLILLDSENNEVFRKSGMRIWQTEGEETRDLKVSIDNFKDAINNPRSVIRPKFHVKVNDYWEDDIEMQTVPIIDLEAPEVELTNVTAPSEFCPGQLELPAAMYSAAKRCKSKVQARISVLDTVLTTQDFDLVEGESRGLNTLLNFDWDTVNNICNKLNVLPDSSPSVPVKFELFRYTDDIERRAGINTEPLIPVDTVLRTMRMRRPGRLVLIDSQIPKKAQPGYSTSFSFTLRNEGECTGRFRTTVRSSPQVIFDTEDEFKPGETKTYSVSMVMPGFDVIPKVSINRTEGSKTRNLVKQNLRGILMNKVTKIDPRGGITIRAAESPIRFVGFASGTGLKDSKGVESIKTVKTLRGEKQYVLLRGKVNPNDEMNIPASVLEACEMKLSDPMSYVLVNNVIDKDASRVKYSNNAASMLISRRRAAGMYKDFLKMEL